MYCLADDCFSSVMNHNNLVVALWGDDSAGDCVEALVAPNESEFVTRIVVANFDLAECDGHGVISLFAG